MCYISVPSGTVRRTCREGCSVAISQGWSRKGTRSSVERRMGDLIQGLLPRESNAASLYVPPQSLSNGPLDDDNRASRHGRYTQMVGYGTAYGHMYSASVRNFLRE